MSRRLLSPSASHAPWWGPQTAGPGPAKRRRIEEPAGPESWTAPSLPGLVEPRVAGAPTSVVVLPPGCALHLSLNGVDLVLEPEPPSVLQVSQGGRTLVLIPEALLGSGSGGGARLPVGLEPGPGALLVVPGEDVTVQQWFLRARVPENAVQEEACLPDPAFLTPWVVGEAGSVAGTAALGFSAHSPVGAPWPQAPTPSPQRRSPGFSFKLGFHTLEPFPSPPLQPLPPSPSPGPHQRPQRLPGPAPKARRRLFQE